MNLPRSSLGFTLALLLALSQAVHAQWKDWDYDLDQERKPWQEMQLQLPPYPKNENLVALDLGVATTNRFLIDLPSVSVGEDGVVRYTLVVRTGGGATNVTFEGLRCDTNSQRVYAIGHPGNQWSRARVSEWRDVVRREVNGHHYVLYSDYLCFGVRKRSARTLKEIVTTLKNGPQRLRVE